MRRYNKMTRKVEGYDQEFAQNFVFTENNIYEEGFLRDVLGNLIKGGGFKNAMKGAALQKLIKINPEWSSVIQKASSTPEQFNKLVAKLEPEQQQQVRDALEKDKEKDEGSEEKSGEKKAEGSGENEDKPDEKKSDKEKNEKNFVDNGAKIDPAFLKYAVQMSQRFKKRGEDGIVRKDANRMENILQKLMFLASKDRPRFIKLERMLTKSSGRLAKELDAVKEDCILKNTLKKVIETYGEDIFN